MKILQIIKSAFKSIFAKKLRSILTMLGVIIGIMAVIVLVGIGQGTTSSVMENMQGLHESPGKRYNGRNKNNGGFNQQKNDEDRRSLVPDQSQE
jgi:ABC-type antimicrobial peptide transport system permease subunit